MGGCQTGGAGSFPRTKREVLGGTKIHLFEFAVKYLNFGATYSSFGSIYLNLAPNIRISRHIFEFWRNKFKVESFRRVLGGGGWVPQDLRQVWVSVSGKNIPPTPCFRGVQVHP